MNILDTYAWKTHQPVLKTVLDLHQIENVIEFGIGDNSTPLLKDVEWYLGVENDQGWFERVKKMYPNLNLKLQKLPSNISLPTKSISDKVRSEILLDYDYFISLLQHTDLAFIDSWVCNRYLALQKCIQFGFDFIVYHDAQPKSKRVYNYHTVNREGYKKYYLTSPTSWTCLLVKNSIEHSFEQLVILSNKYVEEFKKKYPICRDKMYWIEGTGIETI